MNISAISTSLVNQYNLASKIATRQMEKLAANSRLADSPSDIGTAERLKSLASESRILAKASNPGILEVNALKSHVTSSASRAEMNLMTGTEDSMRELVSSLRALSSVSTLSGIQAFAGDALNPEKITIETPATSATSVAAAGPYVLSADSSVDEGGVMVDKSTFTFNLDGNEHSVKIDSGSYDASTLASALSGALSDQTGLNSSDISFAAEGSALKITSGSQGGTSSLSFSGAASSTGLASSVGTDLETEEVDGPAGVLNVRIADREFKVFNASAAADKIEKSLDSGDLSGAMATGNAVQSALSSLESTLTFTAGRLDSDSAVLMQRAGNYEAQLENLTKLDVSSTMVDLTRQQIRMQQSSWALSQVSSMARDNMRALFNIN